MRIVPAVFRTVRDDRRPEALQRSLVGQGGILEGQAAADVECRRALLDYRRALAAVGARRRA